MYPRFVRRVRIELSHFRTLTPDVRRLLLSYALFVAAWPLVMVFLNAYFWRSGGVWPVVLYNTGYITGLPVGFYINGLLLRRFHLLRLYLAGAVLQGFPAILAVFYPSHAAVLVFVYGLLFGIGAGLFWGNKNYISLQLTRGINRVYYNSLEQLSDLAANILVPVLAGWFIVLAGKIIIPDNAYRLVMLTGFVLLFFSGWVVQSSGIGSTVIRGMRIRRPRPAWQAMRWFNVIYNTQIGLNLVLNSVLILVLVGGEGILGTVQTLTAVLSGMVLYVIGRKTTIDTSWKLVGVGTLIYLAGSAVLAGSFSWIGAIIYSACVTTGWAFTWTSSYSVSMELMDSQERSAVKQYAYVCDNEVFFNIGRAAGLAILGVLIVVSGKNPALRWAPLIVAVLQLPQMWVLKILVDRIRVPGHLSAVAAETPGKP